MHLSKNCPDRSFAILEGRDAIGGTWDLFRYPGIRSDSDMHTLGFAFKPWTHEKSIADAPAILDYLHETASEYGIEKLIRYNHRVTRIEWDSATARWTVTVRKDDTETLQMQCRFLYMCTGYYSYTDPYQPEFPGRDTFKGPVFHPQFWPEGLDYKGKSTVVIGSGATAVTIIPAIRAILDSPDLKLDGFIGPGHVSTVIGLRPYGFIARDHGKPVVVSGFEPLDVLQGAQMILRQLAEGRSEVENQYMRVVREQGNPLALEAIAEQALRRGTGARGLRAILEEVLLNTMYELPGRSDVGSVMIDAETVRLASADASL